MIWLRGTERESLVGVIIDRHCGLLRLDQAGVTLVRDGHRARIHAALLRTFGAESVCPKLMLIKMPFSRLCLPCQGWWLSLTGNRPMENDRAYTIGVVLLGTVPAVIVVILLLL